MTNTAPARATVTCTVDDAPANICPPTIRHDTFEIEGDGKALLVLRFNTDTHDIRDAFAAARRRARRVQGATAIRHGGGIYTI